MTRREAMLWLRGIAPRQYADLLFRCDNAVAEAVLFLIDTEPMDDQPVDVNDFQRFPDFDDWAQ